MARLDLWRGETGLTSVGGNKLSVTLTVSQSYNTYITSTQIVFLDVENRHGSPSKLILEDLRTRRTRREGNRTKGRSHSGVSVVIKTKVKYNVCLVQFRQQSSQLENIIEYYRWLLARGITRQKTEWPGSSVAVHSLAVRDLTGGHRSRVTLAQILRTVRWEPEHTTVNRLALQGILGPFT